VDCSWLGGYTATMTRTELPDDSSIDSTHLADSPWNPAVIRGEVVDA